MPDFNKLAKLEVAIGAKYGQEAIVNPKSYWSRKKEKDYLQQLDEESSKLSQNFNRGLDESEHGFLIAKRLIKESNRTCELCKTYSFCSDDDVFMLKYGCCEVCYIKYIENRVDRWEEGWRPHENNES